MSRKSLPSGLTRWVGTGFPIRTCANSRNLGPVRSPRRLEIERFGDVGDLGALASHDFGKFLRSAARRGLRGGVELGVGVFVVSHHDDVGADLFAQLG